MSAASRLEAPQSMDDLLLFRISRILGVGGSLVIRLCEGRFGITRREWRIIALLHQGDSLLSSELALRAQLDRARTSRAIGSPVSKKLLTRESRPGDRRQAALSLTEKGRALYAELFPLVFAINQELLTVLASAEVTLLDSALDRLQARADAAVAATDLPHADRWRGGRAPRSLG